MTTGIRRIPEAPHDVASPFPFVKDDRVIANDEQCYCKHLRSAHFDAAAYGHGPCIRCGCAKFTWMRFLGPNVMPDPPAQWPGTHPDDDARAAARKLRGRG